MRHSDSTLNLVTIIASVLFITAALLVPHFADGIAIWVVLASVFIIGIPHGAIDHVMAAELYNLNQTLKDHLLFYASYLLVMVIVGALWIFYPVWGMIFFLVISIYHFGQADMEDFLAEKRSGNRLLHVNRGLLIIGLIVFSDTTVTYPIMADAMRISQAQFSGLMPDPQIAIAMLAGIYITASLFGIVANRMKRTGTYVLDSALLASVLILTGPLIGFGLYFALWHSAGHINEMRDFFENRGKFLSIGQFYKKALPFTLVSIFGLALLMGVNVTLNLENQFLSLMFILISVLTLPHMLIVERMYEEKKQA